jgi:regulatory protein
MPTITRIEQQKRRPNRRSVYIDNDFAFGCNVNVIARFRLREGMTIDNDLRRRIEEGEVQQEAFDHATRLLGMRMQSERELRMKLGRKDYGPGVIDAVIENLKRLNYVDDAKFAASRAKDQATLKKHGQARAVQELMKAGVSRDLADKATAKAYEAIDPRESAVETARKKAATLSRYDAETAKRRLIGFLQRRGFDYETVQYAVGKTLRP